MHQFSEADIRHIARLARLSMSEHDVQKFPEQLSNILSFVSSLQKVETNGVPPTHHVSEGVSVVRDDVVQESDTGLNGSRVRVPSVFQ